MAYIWRRPLASLRNNDEDVIRKGLYLLAAYLEARNPPGTWVIRYPQKKDESTTPIVSGAQSNSGICRYIMVLEIIVLHYCQTIPFVSQIIWMKTHKSGLMRTESRRDKTGFRNKNIEFLFMFDLRQFRYCLKSSARWQHLSCTGCRTRWRILNLETWIICLCKDWINKREVLEWALKRVRGRYSIFKLWA